MGILGNSRIEDLAKKKRRKRDIRLSVPHPPLIKGNHQRETNSRLPQGDCDKAQIKKKGGGLIKAGPERTERSSLFEGRWAVGGWSAERSRDGLEIKEGDDLRERPSCGGGGRLSGGRYAN